MVKLSGKKTVHIKTANVPSYDVSSEALQEVKARYRDKLMRDVDQMPHVRNQFAEDYPYIPSTKAVTPVAFSQAYQLKGMKFIALLKWIKTIYSQFNERRESRE